MNRQDCGFPVVERASSVFHRPKAFHRVLGHSRPPTRDHWSYSPIFWERLSTWTASWRGKKVDCEGEEQWTESCPWWMIRDRVLSWIAPGFISLEGIAKDREAQKEQLWRIQEMQCQSHDDQGSVTIKQ